MATNIHRRRCFSPLARRGLRSRQLPFGDQHSQGISSPLFDSRYLEKYLKLRIESTDEPNQVLGSLSSASNTRKVVSAPRSDGILLLAASNAGKRALHMSCAFVGDSKQFAIPLIEEIRIYVHLDKRKKRTNHSRGSSED